MSIFDRLFGRKGAEPESVGAKIPRFAPISEHDELLLPRQIEYLKTNLKFVSTEVLALMDPSDEMLPEYAFFVPNMVAEFNENPNLAMIHGLGTAHAWIDVGKLREILDSDQNITDYRSLFRAIVARGYDVKRIKYIRFRSSMNSLE
jgi:hypothetical protein